MTHLRADELTAEDLGELFMVEYEEPGMQAEYLGVLTWLSFETSTVGTLAKEVAQVILEGVHVRIGNHDLVLRPEHPMFVTGNRAMPDRGRNTRP